VSRKAQDIYDPQFVVELFDEMSGSYERMNYITSFGFSARWRRQLVDQVQLRPGDVVADLMTGMGECWKPILKRIGPSGQLLALDFSEGMLRFARQKMRKYPQRQIIILKEDLFHNSIADHSVDAAISGFGMKTFSPQQLHRFAAEVARILKPNGHFCLMDISVPQRSWLRWPYMFYLKRIIPFLGRVFLGNPENYRMLGIYNEHFVNAKKVAEIFAQHGLEVRYVEYFYGCASGIVGRLPHLN
jgi:ubiquinone/menaquinone biosynthesis methyltransferase